MPENLPGLAVFDLDGTLTWRDTLTPFLFGFLLRHPPRLRRLWRAPLIIADYLFRDRDRGVLKGRFIRMVMGGTPRPGMAAWADTFVAGLQARHTFRQDALARLEAHRAAGDHLVLLSASPDLYVPRIGYLLGFERTVCTEIAWRANPPHGEVLDGALKSANRRGEEKCVCLAWLRKQYPGMAVSAYGNSASDLPHLRLAERGLLVNGNAAARRAAAAMGLAAAQWN